MRTLPREKPSLPLAETIGAAHRVVSIIPRSGIQFLDYGFSLVLPDGKRNEPAPRSWGFVDHGRNPEPLPRLLSRGDENVAGLPGREDYEISQKQLILFAARTWLPLPLLREKVGGGFLPGPVNWARAYVVPLPDRDSGKHDHRLVIAIDTNLIDHDPRSAYLAPSADDAKTGQTFSLPTRPEQLNFFLQQEWVRNWVNETLKLMLQSEERQRKGRREVILSAEEVAERLQGPNEALARYMSLLDLLNELDFMPKLKLVDTETLNSPVHVDVEMVLDLGNSRTCGLLVEAEPESRGVDINSAFKLELRDLSRPEQVYSDPFDSRLEFALARFGSEEHSQTSKRYGAFSWPTIVRVGPEAVWLAGTRRGSDGRTGMSSPKRYLWDKDRAQQPWKFNSGPSGGESEGVAAQGLFATFVNDAGRPLHVPDAADDDQLPTFLARFSRSNLVTFALAEIFLQAVVMMNAPVQRLRRRSAEVRRRLRRLILTMPTALSIEERRLLQERAEAARDLVYLCLGWVQKPLGTPALDWGNTLKPVIELRWDEASATQVVYLYSQIALNFSGDARAFMRAIKAAGRAGGTQDRPDNMLTVGTIDIGGGTTDLVITTLTAEGQGAHVTIFPQQNFRESFALAGDDIVQALSREIVVGGLQRAIKALVTPARAEVIVQDLFGGNRGDMTAEDELRRAQFATQIASRVAVAILGAYEVADPLQPPELTDTPLKAFFADSEPPPALIAALNRTIRQHTGSADFSLLEVPITVDLRQVERTVRSLTSKMFEALTEICWRFRVDLVLLSGRPSRLPAIRDMVVESGALPAHRVVAMHQFRVGQWYPFRDAEARIKDPKTTAAVGGMICLLAEGHLPNFNFRSNRLAPRSVARYLGKIETVNRLLDQDVYYGDLDLENPEFELPEQSFEFRGPMALGVRQFPREWWPASLLYMIDYRNEEARAKFQPMTPLKIQLKRGRAPRKIGTADQAQEPNDSLAVDSAESDRGSAKGGLELRLQTILHRDGYWLDTGVLLDV